MSHIEITDLMTFMHHPTGLAVPTTVTYSTEYPHELTFVFCTGPRFAVWVVGRDLLHAGIHSPKWVGDGDVRVTGLPPTLNIRRALGSATFRMPAAFGALLHQTFALVPPGAEISHYDLDAELAAILEAG